MPHRWGSQYNVLAIHLKHIFWLAEGPSSCVLCVYSKASKCVSAGNEKWVRPKTVFQSRSNIRSLVKGSHYVIAPTAFKGAHKSSCWKNRLHAAYVQMLTPLCSRSGLLHTLHFPSLHIPLSYLGPGPPVLHTLTPVFVLLSAQFLLPETHCWRILQAQHKPYPLPPAPPPRMFDLSRQPVLAFSVCSVCSLPASAVVLWWPSVGKLH